jgi:hypothetical protein
MVDWILLATALASWAIAVVYGVVGYRLYLRPVSDEAQFARAQFSIWWYGLGISAAMTGLESVLAAGGVLSLAEAVTVSLITVLIDCVFLWAIVDFMVYLYTGRYYLLPIAGFYGLFYFAALYYTVLEHPYGLVVRAGVPTLLIMPVNHLLEAVVVVGLVFPEFIAAFLYLSLLRRTEDRSQRFRITVVGVSILLWFGITFFFPASTAAENLLRGFLQLIPALLTLGAYLPPAWVRRRFRISGIEGPAPAEIAAAPSAS